MGSVMCVATKFSKTSRQKILGWEPHSIFLIWIPSWASIGQHGHKAWNYILEDTTPITRKCVQKWKHSMWVTQRWLFLGKSHLTKKSHCQRFSSQSIFRKSLESELIKISKIKKIVKKSFKSRKSKTNNNRHNLLWP